MCRSPSAHNFRQKLEKELEHNYPVKLLEEVSVVGLYVVIFHTCHATVRQQEDIFVRNIFTVFHFECMSYLEDHSN